MHLLAFNKHHSLMNHDNTYLPYRVAVRTIHVTHFALAERVPPVSVDLAFADLTHRGCYGYHGETTSCLLIKPEMAF